MLRYKTLYLFLLVFVLMQTNFSALAQNNSSPINEWVKKLESKDDVENTELLKIWWYILKDKDSADVYNCLTQLEASGASGRYFKARLSFMKAGEAFNLHANVAKVKQLGEQALNDAYETGDDALIAYICWFYGQVMQSYSEMELSVTYYLKAGEIISQFQQKPSYAYIAELTLGEMLYHTRDYEKCIEYTKKGLANWPDKYGLPKQYQIRYWNTMGQAYMHLGLLDSALANYQRSMELANNLNDQIWRGINNVFMAELFYLQKDYSKAKQLIEYDYKVKYTDEPNVSAYGLQLLANINLLKGDKDSALLHIRQALQLLENSHDLAVQRMDYLQLAYYTAADVFRALGNTDSFYHYNNLYAALHDSLERVATLSSTKITRLRIDNEKNYQTILLLNRQKDAEKQTRNFIIISLVMLSFITILILNRQRQKSKYKAKLALQQKAVAEAERIAAETEVASAKEQLNMFAQNVIEKTILIEKLEQQVRANEYNFDQQQLIKELSNQTILTEDDWLKFKMLFEKTHPGFFIKLKEQVHDITQAEKRMAALTRLHLTTKQMAAVLGISPNSVIKAKQRLRQRFNLQTDFHVEGFISSL